MRRALPIAAIAAFLVPAVALPAASRQMVRPVEPLEAAVVAELNAVRVQHGLRPLRSSPALATSAETHSLEMVEVGFFAHESSDGTPYWQRIRRYYAPGLKQWRVGENLMWKAPSVTAREAVQAWLRSPGHRRNVLQGRFREVGVSAIRAVGAPGVYGRRSVIVLTADFGTR